MTIRVDEAGALALLRQVVEEKGTGFVYERQDDTTLCRYVHDNGEPGCLVGHVLIRAGLTVDEAARLDDYGAFDVAVGCLDGWAFSWGAVYLLCVAQDAQDDGESWGESLRRAERAPRSTEGEVA